MFDFRTEIIVGWQVGKRKKQLPHYYCLLSRVKTAHINRHDVCSALCVDVGVREFGDRWKIDFPSAQRPAMEGLMRQPASSSMIHVDEPEHSSAGN